MADRECPARLERPLEVVRIMTCSPVITVRLGSNNVSRSLLETTVITPQSKSELDSRADTCVLGDNALITHSYDKFVKVTGFDPGAPAIEAEIVSGALTYDQPDTGEVIVLMVHKALLTKGRSNNLLNPMQMRMNDIEVNGCSKYLRNHPTENDHAIVVDSESEKLIIPLSLNYTASYILTRLPTMGEYNNCRRMSLTAESPD